jgi:hypothetical protein
MSYIKGQVQRLEEAHARTLAKHLHAARCDSKLFHRHLPPLLIRKVLDRFLMVISHQNTSLAKPPGITAILAGKSMKAINDGAI